MPGQHQLLVSDRLPATVLDDRIGNAGEGSRQLNVRLWNWIAAIFLTLILVAIAIPRSVLFSGTEWQRAFQGHPWLSYLDVVGYLLGILAATLVFAVIGVFLLRSLAGTPIMRDAIRFLLGGASIFGLSPLQPVFANIIVILIVPTLAESGLVGIESLRWVFTAALISLFGLALGAELALKIIDAQVRDSRGWLRTTAQVIGAQASALAGRLAVMIMAGPLMMAAISGIGLSPSEVAPEAERIAFPVEGLIIAFFAALLGMAIWLLSRRIGGRPDEPVHEYHGASPVRHVLTWSVVLLAIVVPLVMLISADDPMMQRIEAVEHPPTAQHPFGTDQLGRDVYTRLAFAWRDAVYGGLSIGIVLFGLGVMWRLITPFNRSLLAIEPILERMPPAVIFFGLWGALSGMMGDSVTIRTVAIASGVILLPTALSLIRRVEVPALPAAGGALALMGLLLVIGWSTVMGQLGLLASPVPNFGDQLALGREYAVEAPWMADYAMLIITTAVVLPMVGLVLLSRCYGISRELIRLRG